MGRGFTVAAVPPDYYKFDTISEIQQQLINHIAKLKNDIEWSSSSWFGFFVNKPLKNEKKEGLGLILQMLNTNAINTRNFAGIINKIEETHPNLHTGSFFMESHKIIKGMKMFYLELKNMEPKEGSQKSFK